MYSRLVNLLKPAVLPQRRWLAGGTVPRPPTKSRATAIETPDDRVRRLLAEETDTILYSSYVDNLTPGWRQASVQTRRARKEQNQQMRAAVEVKPFSLALQYMQDDAGGGGGGEKAVASAQIDDALDEEEEEELKGKRASSDVSNNAKRAWMQDYEAYHEKEDGDDGCEEDVGIYGTPDPSVPVSKIPCYGCGARLQCAEPALPGYLPSEIFAGQKPDYLKSITCQRCHFLRHYNTVIDVTVPPAEYVRLISSIQDRFALAILLVDVTDLPCSIWPNMADIIGDKRPVIVVGNKVDLLPRDTANHLAHVRACLQSAVTATGIASTNIKHTCLISAATGFGVEELITKLHNVWSYRGDVYLLGCTNVGKSTLFNALLRSDYCKSRASSLISKATASPWPGTTMRMLKFPIMRPNDWRMFVRTKRIMSQKGQRAAEEQLRRDQAQDTKRAEHATLIGHIDQTFRAERLVEVSDSFGLGQSKKAHADTLNERSKEFATSKWCFDTPGVIQPEQTLNLLTTAELLLTIPRRMMTPRTYRLQRNQSLFLAGLGRLDYVRASQGAEEAGEDDAIRVTVYASDRLPVLIVPTGEADRLYAKFVGTDVLAVPHEDEADSAERLSRWPAMRGETIRVLGEGKPQAACDIVLSSAGWIGVHASAGVELVFRAWTPEGRGIVQRTPALVPFGQRLSGPRIRGSLAHQNKRAFA